jgi:hypothetical protein
LPCAAGRELRCEPVLQATALVPCFASSSCSAASRGCETVFAFRVTGGGSYLTFVSSRKKTVHESTAARPRGTLHNSMHSRCKTAAGWHHASG